MAHELEADIIVIGAGSAGSAAAGRLSQDGRFSVLVIEAGRSDRHPFTRVPALNVAAVLTEKFDWCFKAEPDPSVGNRVDTWAAGKVLGGGGAINGMMFIRGHATDYDHWAALGATGWDYASVLPYFRRMERNERGADDHRGNAGPLSVSEVRAPYAITRHWIEAAMQAGIPRNADLNGAACDGVDLVQASQRNGWRHSAATAYLPRNRANLRVELNARVTAIRVQDGRATGVAYTRNGVAHAATARRGVVLSGGTVNSARLLLLSGIGPATELHAHGIEVVKDLPGVGRNLQEHVGAHLAHGVSARTLNSDTGKLRGLGHVANFVTRGRGALTTPIGHAQAFVATRPHLPAPNIQLIFAPLAFAPDESGRIKLLPESSVSTMIGVMRPRSRGSVTLRGADPALPPVIRYTLLGDDDDVAQLVEGMQLARRIAAQPAFAAHVTHEIMPGERAPDGASLPAYLRVAAAPLYHPVGTCRMGTDPLSVVGPDLQVHGIAGLWVADASIMPSLPSGNTNATAIMIGDKAGDHIRAAIANT